MRNANYLKAGLVVIIIIVGAMAALISCNRQFAVPVSAVNSPTPTSTGGTGSGATATNTPNGPTNTATNTATMTPTTAPISNYLLIDDFEATGAGTNPGDDSYNIYQVADQNGHTRDGNWFGTTDAPSGSPVTNYVYTPAFAGSYSAEFSGTLAAQASYASYGFSFTNPTGTNNAGVSYYDATVAGTGNYTGIVFEIKAKSFSVSICTGVQPVVVDMIDITPGGVTTDHQIAVPVTANWQAVTIFYNQCLSATGTALNPVSMYQVVFKPQSLGDTGFSYDFLIDNIQFTAAVAPAPASASAWPNGNTVIDTFQNGINDTQSTWLGAGVTAGYWSDFDDSTAGALCPSYIQGNPPSQPGFCLDIATGAGLPTVVNGVPGFEAHLSDSNIDYGPPSYLGFCGMGFYFNNAQPAGGTDISQGGTYSTLNFYAKGAVAGLTVYAEMNDAATYQDACYAPSVNYYSFTTATTWTKYTIGFNPSDGTYNLGSPVLTIGTNGCNAAHTPSSGSAHPYSYTTAEQIQWEPQGSSPIAIDLAVADIYLQ